MPGSTAKESTMSSMQRNDEKREPRHRRPLLFITVLACALSFSACQEAEPPRRNVIAVAALDFSRYTAMLEANPDVRGAWIGMMNELTSHSEMVRGPDHPLDQGAGLSGVSATASRETRVFGSL